MKKNVIKVLIILAILLVSILLLPEVKATNTSTSNDLIEKILNVIPDTMEVNVKESEYKKVHDVVTTNLTKIFEKNGISIEDAKKQNVDISIGRVDIYFTEDNFRKCHVSISADNYYKDKTIDLTYSNHKDFNKDEQNKIKAIKLTSPKYYEVDISFIKDDMNLHDRFFEIATKYYENIINDSKIKVIASAGAGDDGINMITGEGGTYIGIFKNDILYDIRKMGSERSVPVINLPSDITDDEINEYIIKEITKYNKKMGEAITKIEKGTKEIAGLEIEDGYSVYFKQDNFNYYLEGCVIARRKIEDVNIDNDTTDIKLEADTTVVPKDTVIETTKIENEESLKIVIESMKDVSNNFVTYDISLKSKGVKIQPNGKVKIKIPIPSEFDKKEISVYRILEDGTKIKYDTTIEDGYVTFETDHFSLYVLAQNNAKAEEKTRDAKVEQPENKTNTVEETKTVKREKDSTPKTGNKDIIFYILGIALISILGIVYFTKRK